MLLGHIRQFRVSPLKAKATVAERIPEWKFPSPEAFPMMERQRIAEVAEVAEEKRSHSQHDFRIRGEDACSQNEREAARGEPLWAGAVVSGLHCVRLWSPRNVLQRFGARKLSLSFVWLVSDIAN